jgi:hypothetical protein
MRSVDGLVSMDDDFRWKPKELITLEQTKLTVVIVSGVGHDPVRATGLVLHKLKQLCGQHTKRCGQLWYLASGPVDPRDIRKDLAALAGKRRTTADKLIAENKLTKRQLDSEALDQLGVGERG